MKKILSAFALTGAVMLATPAMSATDSVPPPAQSWPHAGITSSYDKAALQRGFQIYREVCAACHGLKYVAYRNLADLGYSEAEVKAIAAEYTINDGPNDDGEMFERPGRPSDYFKAPFVNDQAARAANGGALPPDLSLIVKSRAKGEDYLYALLTGYEDAPEGTELLSGMYWNKYFPGHQMAMAPPLVDGQVTYADGTSATLDQAARDVTQFLAWAGEPHMESRKQMGIKVILFMLVFAGIMYAVKRKIWANVH